MAGTEARDPATLRLDSIVRQRDWIENGEINCTSIVGSSLEPRTCIHTYKFFHVRAAARSHFSWDPPLFLFLPSTRLSFFLSTPRIYTITIRPSIYHSYRSTPPSHDISFNGAPFSFDNCRYPRAAASSSYCWRNFDNSFQILLLYVSTISEYRCQIAARRTDDRYLFF